MSLFKRETRALPTTIDPYQITARPYYPNYSGEVISEQNAFASSAVLACVSLIADTIATMPLELTRQRGGRIESIPTPSVLIKPNATQSMFEFVHEVVATLALHGCAYIYAPRRAGELPSEMRAIHPNHVKTKYDTDVDDVYYEIGDQRFENGDIRAIHWLLLAGQRRGVSPLEAQRNTIGMALAMDRFLAQFYGEGATPSSVLESDKPITPEQAQVLRDTWEESHHKRRRPAVLSNGLRWRSITTSAADMQMLEHRESIIRDIARVYRVPLHLISGTGGDSQTYQNIESMGTNFVRFTLLPWMRRVEDAISEMLPITQRVRFNADEFMRADLITRVRAQQIQIMNGTLTPNEARADDDREPYEGGDQFIIGIAGAPMSSIEGGDLPLLGTDAIPPER
jgi:HK97 family phage portal protein